MFFVTAKILWAFIQPLTFIALCFVAAFLLRKSQAGQKLMVATCVVFLLFGFLPIGPLLLASLERQNPVPELPAKIDGFIILGGAIDVEGSARHGNIQFTSFATRLTEMIRLSRIYPQADIVYSGGSGNLTYSEAREADLVPKILKDLGIPDDRLVIENRSRNSFENVEYSYDLVHPQPGENWVLITSAFHLPRAMKIFEKKAWAVIPYPAGFIENESFEPRVLLDVLGNYWKLKIAVREYIAIIAYQISGKI